MLAPSGDSAPALPSPAPPQATHLLIMSSGAFCFMTPSCSLSAYGQPSWKVSRALVKGDAIQSAPCGLQLVNSQMATTCMECKQP
jgi:hypothetical protein